MENIINQWCNRWLSRGGRLVLVNSILEEIHVYCHIITYIPKGILYKIIRESFRFLWLGNKEKGGIGHGKISQSQRTWGDVVYKTLFSLEKLLQLRAHGV
jgi:hypothetical protein